MNANIRVAGICMESFDQIENLDSYSDLFYHVIYIHRTTRYSSS